MPPDSLLTMVLRHRRRKRVVAASGRLEIGDQGTGGFFVVFGDLQFDAAHREDQVRHGLRTVFVGEQHRDAAVFEHRFQQLGMHGIVAGGHGDHASSVRGSLPIASSGNRIHGFVLDCVSDQG